MNPGKWTMEFKVGIFVFLGLLLLGYMVINAGDFTAQPGYYLRVIFDSASGLQKGSPVRLAGVDAGEVAEIRVYNDTEQKKKQVEVLAWLRRDVQIEKDAAPHINSLGILGEKYLEITPGSLDAPILVDGETLWGKEKSGQGFESLTESGERLIRKMELTVDSINEVVADERVRNSFKKTVSNSETATDDLKEAAASAKVVMTRLKNGEGTLGRLMADEEIYNNIRDMTEDLKANPWKIFFRPRVVTPPEKKGKPISTRSS